MIDLVGDSALDQPIFHKHDRSRLPQIPATEVPANDSKATGILTATYDETSKKLTWKGKDVRSDRPATAAHFHGPAEAGKNAAVVIPITGAEKDSFEGSATLTDGQAADMLAGKWYVNVHTAANKGGEIRGQLTK